VVAVHAFGKFFCVLNSDRTLAMGRRSMLDDSTRMAEKMQTAGVAAILDIWPELWHDWPVFSDAVPEGEQALEKIAAFISNYMNRNKSKK
jgi:acetyl esterase/lipase